MSGWGDALWEQSVLPKTTTQWLLSWFHGSNPDHSIQSPSSIGGVKPIPLRRGSFISPYRSPHRQVRPSYARAGWTWGLRNGEIQLPLWNSICLTPPILLTTKEGPILETSEPAVIPPEPRCFERQTSARTPMWKGRGCSSPPLGM